MTVKRDDWTMPVMNDSSPYIKIVEWSNEDQCFIGQCPGIIGPCCHGTNEAQVYAELCEIVNEWIETLPRNLLLSIQRRAESFLTRKNW
jgi:hypothetical protein